MKQIIIAFFIIAMSGCTSRYSLRKTAKDELDRLFFGNRIVQVPTRYFEYHYIIYVGDTILLNRHNFVAYKDTLLKEYYIFKQAEHNMLEKIKTDSTLKVISYIVDLPPLH